MRKTAVLAATALAVILGAGLARSATEILPLEDVKTGMKGKGRTVFAGNKVEEFDVEILGVLANTGPKRNAIIARLSGRNLEQTGVLQGMSGSPVYIDGKIIGAVAFSFSFAKEPIAGITPIGEMLAIAGDSSGKPGPGTARLPFSERVSLRDLFEAHRDYFSPPAPFEADGRTSAALPVPLLFSGFSPRLLDEIRPYFAGLGFSVRAASAPGAGQRTGIALNTDLNVKEGDPLAVQLISGDLDVSAIGTATYIDGARVYAFGHPLYNLGPVEYGMAKADIITVVPAYNSSFKLGSVGSLIGAVVQDRTSGAYGEIGRVPKTVPLNITLTRQSGPAREYRLRLASDKLLTPLLANMAVASLIGAEDRAVGDLSLELSGDVYLDTSPGQAVHIEDLFTGNLGRATTDLSGLVTAVVYFLTNNEFKDVGIHRIDLNIRTSERPKSAVLERVWLDRYEAAPGETLRLKLFIKSYRGESRVEEIPFLAPNLPPGSEFNLIVADTRSLRQVELGQYRTSGIVPRSLEQLVRLLNNLRKNNRVYFKIVAARPGLFLRGEEMPNLTPAMKSLFASPRAAATAPVEISVSTLREYQMPVPFVFEGLAVIPLKIRN
ncbi:MAG: SpoIVB peptidase S55 domain-containing protein [Acidobacteriota bacterium]|nr:SpoIVB peptidase S55 domain-containing protein [Acidobacteriota bacterium]MDD8028677.1 SpoIVB peptidase S55 domain-containing protein [Acidobacteriota bacterium]MDD8033153.1 SpoIVB peptidase S55 domain-containing protein [Acidobacteriota bacterium]HNT32692.1 SpoIVB peptidase S55 domain-containing protein [Candidatus Aminicenantes bacterium]